MRMLRKEEPCFTPLNQLWLLDRTLLEIELLTRQHGDGATPELRGLCETAKRAVARCLDQVTTFLQRIRSYQGTFDHGQNPNTLREIGHAIRWRIGEKEALERFRAELAGTTSSLRILMVTANTTLLQVNRKEMKHDLDDVKRRNDIATLSHDASLNVIKDELKNTDRNIEAGNSILGCLSEAIKLEWLRNLVCELLGLVRSAMMVNFATYRAVSQTIPIRFKRPKRSNRSKRSKRSKPVILNIDIRNDYHG
ncbi:unnamed protein product [Alternaria sp. RS040]